MTLLLCLSLTGPESFRPWKDLRMQFGLLLRVTTIRLVPFTSVSTRPEAFGVCLETVAVIGRTHVHIQDRNMGVGVGLCLPCKLQPKFVIRFDLWWYKTLADQSSWRPNVPISVFMFDTFTNLISHMPFNRHANRMYPVLACGLISCLTC